MDSDLIRFQQTPEVDVIADEKVSYVPVEGFELDNVLDLSSWTSGVGLTTKMYSIGSKVTTIREILKHLIYSPIVVSCLCFL